MNWLIFTDPHFTDNPIEDYRWDIFNTLLEVALRYEVTEIICCGDLTDKKDRFSSSMVNKLVEQFSFLQAHTGATIQTIAGNHEKPVNGPYYWKFLNKLGLKYITSPTLYKYVWLLPFSPNPISDWQELDLKTATAILMHQTGQGVKVEGDRELSSNNLPIFPRNVRVLSGDVHRPQTADGIVYIGAPYPVRFGEDWDNRVIVVVKDNFKEFIDIPVPSIKRLILDISCTDELSRYKLPQNSQIRVRYTLSGEGLTTWPVEKQKIETWAERNNIVLVSTEPVLTGNSVTENNQHVNTMELLKPEEVIKLYGKTEKLSQDVVDVGLQLIKSAS